MTHILRFDQMDESLTLWENTKAFFSMPNHAPFKAIGHVADHTLTTIQSVYNGVADDMFIPWKGSQRYLGIPLNYCPIMPITYDNLYRTSDKRLSYESSWAFSAYNELGNSLSDIVKPFSFVRGKIARLTTGVYEGDWHADEDPREVLKVVIPLRTDSSYKFQIQGSSSFNLQVGEALMFDASIPHRVLCDGTSTTARDYLILSVPAWFHVDTELNVTKTDFFSESIPNTFYEKTNLFFKP